MAIRATPSRCLARAAMFSASCCWKEGLEQASFTFSKKRPTSLNVRRSLFYT